MLFGDPLSSQDAGGIFLSFELGPPNLTTKNDSPGGDEPAFLGWFNVWVGRRNTETRNNLGDV